MSMAPHPDRYATEGKPGQERPQAEGRVTKRVTLVDPSSPQVRFLRTQASMLNNGLSTEILDIMALLSTGDAQWRVARSKGLKLLNEHNRAMRNLITAVLEMDPQEIAKLAEFQPGKDNERNDNNGRHSDSDGAENDSGGSDDLRDADDS